eukprot:5294066-Pyramimonas_sp.AAC.1
MCAWMHEGRELQEIEPPAKRRKKKKKKRIQHVGHIDQKLGTSIANQFKNIKKGIDVDEEALLLKKAREAEVVPTKKSLLKDSARPPFPSPPSNGWLGVPLARVRVGYYMILVLVK